MTRWDKLLIAAVVAGAVALVLLFSALAYADGTPNPNTPGYEICNTNSGSTRCGWQAVGPNTPLPVTSTGGGSITPVAPSGALTLGTGGTSQRLFAANEVVHGCTIQNPSTATEPIFVDFTGAPAVITSGGTSIRYEAGQTVPCLAGIAPSVNWVAATTGHAINVVGF